MTLLVRLVRVAFEHRRHLKWLVPIRRPVRIRLEGFSMYVRLDDWAVGARIAVRRRYEPHVTRVFARLLRPGAVVVDVGANVGWYTLLAAARVGPSGQVYAFEPGAESCRLLEQSAAWNAFGHVRVFECAVSDVEGVVGFGLDDSNGRISHERVRESPLQVRSETLDRALAGERRVDVIKVDVEGAEARVLRGARALLERDRPVLVTELSPFGLRLASSVEPEAYLDELRALDYAIRVIPRAGAVPEAQSNAEILRQLPGAGPEDHVDLLATPLESVPRVTSAAR